MIEIRGQGESGDAAPSRHEERDLSIRLVVLFGIALAVVGVASHYLLEALFWRYGVREDRRDTPAPPLREARVEPPSPRLQANPGLDLGALRQREERDLSTYGWVDRSRGTVRIPIERAMKLAAERGLPARPAPKAAD